MNKINDTDRQQFAELYESAFPADERRPTADELALDDNRFGIAIVRHDKQFAGFVTTWHFDKFVYIEHFATLPELRGNGIGRRALETLLAQTELPFVLEVEPPTDTLKTRRMAFYRRAGFHEMPQAYIQPPYHAAVQSLPLRLMTTSNDMSNTFFDEIRKTLYSEVYKVSQP